MFVARIFGDARLLALAKPSNGIQPIIVDEVFYWLISRALCLQFHNMFFFHLLLH
jgi:ABC-type branched-subunit amino acid transport system ATPase component